MAQWVLTKNIAALINQTNKRFPYRNKEKDGTIGDTAHSRRKSGHNPDETGNPEWQDPDTKNEVRACDIDRRLGGGPSGYGFVSMADVIRHLRYLGLNDPKFPLRYFIYMGKEYHEDNNYSPTTYTGANNHNEHAHFSGKKAQWADESEYNYRLDELGRLTTVALSDEDIKAVADEIFQRDVDPSAGLSKFWLAVWDIHRDADAVQKALPTLATKDDINALITAINSLTAAITSIALTPEEKTLRGIRD
jgi:hypothetical protein